MLFPPSLSADLLARSFRATNGELGVLRIDATAFLDACDADDVAVLGWELWLVDHGWDRSGQPCLAPGYWIGVIPTRDGSGSVIGVLRRYPLKTRLGIVISARVVGVLPSRAFSRPLRRATLPWFDGRRRASAA